MDVEGETEIAVPETDARFDPKQPHERLQGDPNHGPYAAGRAPRQALVGALGPSRGHERRDHHVSPRGPERPQRQRRGGQTQLPLELDQRIGPPAKRAKWLAHQGAATSQYEAPIGGESVAADAAVKAACQRAAAKRG